MNDNKKLFSDVFGSAPEVCSFAPGRVNLIGEHTDYNGGFVMPCALDMGIWCSAEKRSDRLMRFYSENFPNDGIVECSLDKIKNDNRWSDYPKSVINAFKSFGYFPEYGADFAFSGNLPDGSGLSSSAALEVVTGLVLRELFGFSVTGQELAVFSQFAENRFIGVNCGIMDQSASAMGKKGNAILLNTDTLAFSYAPVLSEDAALVIVNSGVKHSLASSAYNQRRRECETALSQLNNAVKTPSLCALTPEEFEQNKSAIESPIVRKRAKHAVYENHRTIEAAKLLGEGDLKGFGRLMNESHISLRDDYEVSCEEMDFLAETAWGIEGVFGARMTGGGFGGCTVNLVQKDKINSFKEIIYNSYKNKFGREARFYIAGISDGAHLLPTE